MKCKCKNDHGYTEIKCCNICGCPLKNEPWEFDKKKFHDMANTATKLYKIIDEYLKMNGCFPGNEFWSKKIEAAFEEDKIEIKLNNIRMKIFLDWL